MDSNSKEQWIPTNYKVLPRKMNSTMHIIKYTYYSTTVGETHNAYTPLRKQQIQ
jgi:hypothetical protein